MTDLFDQLPQTANLPTTVPSARAAGGRLSANGKRLGRPPGAPNKGSLQLGKYLEAQFGGMTPGQQSAEIAMVKPRDLKAARAMAKELMIIDLDLSPMMLAQVVKAEQLARALGCKRFEAWELLRREREALFKYVHQVLPPAKDGNGVPPATVFLVPEGEAVAAASIGQLPDDDAADPDFAEEFAAPARQVGRGKSDADT